MLQCKATLDPSPMTLLTASLVFRVNPFTIQLVGLRIKLLLDIKVIIQLVCCPPVVDRTHGGKTTKTKS